MVERYCLPEMSRIWELNNKYRYWLDVELAVCKAMYELEMIPEEDYKDIQDLADFDEDNIAEIEKTAKHDVIAFLTDVAAKIGPAAKWLHYGLTSSDVLDTTNALLLKQAGEIILSDLIRLAEILKIKAKEYKYTLCIGRTHGMHAEPMTFGLKFVLWYDETQRNIKRIEDSLEQLAVGKISGAVGNYVCINPKIEELACEYLGLKPAKVSNQIVARDSYAQFVCTISIIGASIEKIATEIRHLQRTEVAEVEESFSAGQKGSSAMPHKKNPIVAEQLCGMARVLRGYSLTALENCVLWHERDISNSSVERIILPDATILLNYMLNKVYDLVSNLVTDSSKMSENIAITNGVFFSQVLMLALTEKELKKDDAYGIVQQIAFTSRAQNIPFKEAAIKNEAVVNYLNENEIAALFAYERYTKNIDYIYAKSGIK